MTQSPLTLEPGPERRRLMLARGLNVSPNDYTPEEWATVQEQAAAASAAFAEMDESSS